MASLRLINLEKVYDKKVVAVENFNLDIADKEFIVLVGPSGCGKSTTLRMVAGLEDITSGELYIGDKLMNDVAPKDRDIAMVFQNYALYPHMTVYDNMAFALKLRKMKKDEIDVKVQEAAQILGITELLKRKPKALSGGQRQRVAIGRAIVRNPKVFLMDEPLSNLDAKLRNQMRAEIIRLRSRIDTTFIYVTHDQTEAMTLGDRIVVMSEGKIQQTGTPQEVFNRPVNIFVAGFIGVPQMNFFDGKINNEDGAYVVDVYGARVKLNGEMHDKLKELDYGGKDITVGIRPEHITISHGGDSKNVIDSVLSVSEMMGSEVYLHVDVSTADVQHKDIIVRIPTTEAHHELTGPSSGEEHIHFSLEPDLLHLFDKETGDNIIYK